mgnify:CR=1 FL=1
MTAENKAGPAVQTTPSRESPAQTTQVLIVGGGPVGLALAAELGRMNIDCILVDQRDGTIGFPKMNMVSSRSMEFCRRWGIAARVREVGWPDEFPLNIAFVTAMTGYELARFDYPGYAERGAMSHTPDGNRRCPQTLFDPILQARVREFASVGLQYRARLEEFTQDADGVTATIRDLDAGGTRRIRAAYLAGCDGADSLVRAAAGIEMIGNPALTHNINVFFTAAELPGWVDHGRCWANWLVGPDGQWGNIVAVDGHDKWRLSMTGFREGDVLSDAEAAARVRRAVGCDFDFEVHNALPWTRKQQVAETYRRGRVFLAGDAAHLLSPTGGFGMNTGIGDAVDLGWKLAATLDGWGGPVLLDSYEAERRPIGVANVTEATRNHSKLAALPRGAAIAEDSPAGEDLRARIRETIETGGYNQEYEAEGLIVGYSYDGSPVIVPDGTPCVPQTVSEYRPNTRPGARAPHAWISEDVSTLDLFGDGLTLLRTDGGGQSLADAAEDAGVPLSVHDITDPEIAALYESPLVLVRPDGHVCWRGTEPAGAAAVIATVRGAA